MACILCICIYNIKHERGARMKKKNPSPTNTTDAEKAVDKAIQQSIEEFKKKFPGLLEELFEAERKNK